MENYNKFLQSLNINCCSELPSNNCCSELPSNNCCSELPSNNCCSELPSNDNNIEILIRELRRDLNNHILHSESTLNCQNKKITEIASYLKNNLNNEIRELLDTEVFNGILQDQIEDIVLSYLTSNHEKIDNYIKNLFDQYIETDDFHEKIKNIVKMYL